MSYFNRFYHPSHSHTHALRHLLEACVVVALVMGVVTYVQTAQDCMVQTHHGCVVK